MRELQSVPMKRSFDRFLTTHTGSLPRPDSLIRTMFAKEEGVPVDRAALAAEIGAAVADVVKKQAEAGIDLVNDGEMSKPSYATYIKDRLNGFGGESQPPPYPDLVAFPGLHQKVYGDRGRARRKMPGCNGPISVRDREAVKIDIENLKAGVEAKEGKVEDLFISAASPGVVSLFFHNDYYKTHEEYLYAIGDAMQYEYETIASAGLVLQLDCPDLGLGRHVQFPDLSIEEFRGKAQLHVEALNHAVRNIHPSTCECTCAGATTRRRTKWTYRSPTLSTSSSSPGRVPSPSRRQTRDTRTNGRSSKR